jgi:hypothetical protein
LLTTAPIYRTHFHAILMKQRSDLFHLQWGGQPRSGRQRHYLPRSRRDQERRLAVLRAAGLEVGVDI